MSLLGEETLTRRRISGPTYVAGRPTGETSADTAFQGSVQPMNGRDLEVLEEGLRSRDGRKIYCPRGTLRSVDQHAGTQADLVVLDGALYQVIHVDDSHPLIEHDRAYVVRVPEIE